MCVFVCCHLPLHCNDKIVARAHHNILRILVAKIEDIDIVDLDDSIARLQASLLRQTASVDLQKRKRKRKRGYNVCESKKLETLRSNRATIGNWQWQVEFNLYSKGGLKEGK